MKRRFVLKGYSAIRKKVYSFEKARMLYLGRRNLSRHYQEHREVWSVKDVTRTFRVKNDVRVEHQVVK